MIAPELIVKVKGVTVISLDEWNDYQDKIPVMYDWFWTRTAKGVCTKYEDEDGNDKNIDPTPVIWVIEDDQTVVTCNAWRNDCSFRPVLLLDSPGLKYGDKLVYNSLPFIVITPEWAICKWTEDDVMWSNEDEPEDAINWNKSHLKRYCEKYYEAHGNIALLNNNNEITDEQLAAIQENKPITIYHNDKAYDLIDGELVEHKI